jgi:ADP-heptose:LPS heptosyltransferase
MKNILIIKHGSLGDLILSFGAIKTIKHHFPKANLFLLTQTNFKVIFKDLPDVDRIFEDNRKKNLLSVINYLKIIKKYEIDLVVDLQNSDRTQIYHFFAKLFSKTKTLSARKFSYYRYQQQPLGFQHITDNHKDQLKILGINNYYITDLSWMSKSCKFKEKYVIIIPGASKTGEYKKWPIQKYADVSNYLIKNNFKVFLTGSILDKEDINLILSLAPQAKDMTHESRIDVFYDLCLRADIIISNDTGPAHIAGLTNQDLIWLANDNKISRSCYPLGNKVHKILSKNVKDIEIKDVLNKIDEII